MLKPVSHAKFLASFLLHNCPTKAQAIIQRFSGERHRVRPNLSSFVHDQPAIRYLITNASLPQPVLMERSTSINRQGDAKICLQAVSAAWERRGGV